MAKGTITRVSCGRGSYEITEFVIEDELIMIVEDGEYLNIVATLRKPLNEEGPVGVVWYHKGRRTLPEEKFVDEQFDNLQDAMLALRKYCSVRLRANWEVQDVR